MARTDLTDRRHDTLSQHQEMIRTIEPAVADNLRLLVPIDKAWQPTDYVPDLEAESWRNEVERFRAAAATISDELLVVLLTLFAHHIRRCGCRTWPIRSTCGRIRSS